MIHFIFPRGLVQVAKVEPGSSLAPCELNLVFKWRRVEGRSHYPRISTAVVGPTGWPQTDFWVIKKERVA